MLNSVIDKLTDMHIDAFGKELERIDIAFAAFPSEEKLALFDLIFNLSMSNLKNEWPSESCNN